MRSSPVLLAALLRAVAALPQGMPEGVPGPADDGRYTISAPGIKAQFIAYGATLTNLWVKDKNGSDVDVVLGYDNATLYPVDPGHPVYNSIPGRYVNRIGNAKYTIGDTTYMTETNDGNNTLHSGTNNWSFRTWNVTAVTADSITFSIEDPAYSSKGMPGTVWANVTYSVAEGGVWDVKMSATSPEAKTPLMLTQHTYFNLDAYKNPDTAKIWDHTLYLPYSPRYLECDDGALPTGKILTAAPGSINDFASKPDMSLGHALEDPAFSGNCGAGGACEGYNGYWLFDDAPKDAVVVRLTSPFTGIKAEMRTDQKGVQVYTCNWFDGTTPLKSTQGGVTPAMNHTIVGRSSCIAIEAQDYVDGINHPEWGRYDAEITGPGEVYSWSMSWTFGLL